MSSSSDQDYPVQYESRLTLRNGREVFLRPTLPTDAHLVVDLFNRLSPESLQFRMLRRLQALPEELLYHLTHVNYDSEFALVAVVEEKGKAVMIAASRYAYDPDDHMTDLAIVVRDDWQHLGLGKSLLSKIVAIGKEHGIARFGGMMDPRNSIIRQTLADLGYDVKYSLRSGFFQVEIFV